MRKGYMCGKRRGRAGKGECEVLTARDMGIKSDVCIDNTFGTIATT